MMYKQYVLAELLGQKDSVVGINKLFITHSMCTAQRHIHRCAATGTNRSAIYLGLKMQYL